MWESVIIPIYLIRQLPPDKLYALMDILSMADENFEVHTSIRQLMSRWGWGNTKVSNFVKFLEQQDICKAPTRCRQDTRQDTRQDAFLLVNQGFVGGAQDTQQDTSQDTRQDTQQDTNKALERHFQDADINSNFRVSIKKEDAIKRITDTWNELTEYGIEPIPMLGISSMQWQNIITLSKEYGIEDILKTIKKIKHSDFLQGKSKGRWKITFNWFILRNNFIKVINGNYDNRKGTENNGTARTEKKYNDRIGTAGRKNEDNSDGNLF